ncbi:MAG TPA: ABC transporter permease [Pyrinomonadaceae bacterium]|nr:ABC transporter permease [Pyrinomonadaceae bacterium]
MMQFKEQILLRLLPLKLTPEREAEILEELTQHAEDRYRDLLSAGREEEEAFHLAFDEVCGSDLLTTKLKDVVRPVPPDAAVLGDSRRRNFLLDLVSDLRYASRTMRKNPVFSLVAVLTIAIGIGANVLIFTLVERILLSSLPYPDSDRLVRLVQAYPEIGLDTWGLSPANFARYRDGQHSFEALAAFQSTGAILSGSDKSEFLQAGRVSAEFFKVFAVNPVLGRTFAPGEDTEGKNNVVVLSHAFWQRRFGGDAQVVGRWLVIGGNQTQVIGVMPATFKFPSPETEMWLPMALNPQAMHPFMMGSVARLKPGVSVAGAVADTTTILKNAANENPEMISRKTAPPANAGLKTIVTPLKEIIVGGIQKPLLILQIAVGFVLLIACANVANLLLSRATRRTPEIALRLALGAAPGRIIRQLLTESLLLASLGAIVGLGLAWWSLRTVTTVYAQGIPRIQEARITGSVLLVTVGMTFLTGLLFGLVPALRAYRLGLKGGMTEGQRAIAGSANSRLNSSLVVVQLGLSLVLLIGAGLLLKSFQRLMAVKPGFETEKVLSMILTVSAGKGSPEQTIQFYQRLLDDVRTLPGVHSAGLSSNVPFSGRGNSDGHIAEGHEPSGDEAPQAEMKVISPGYFQSMGMPLAQGRDFQEADIDGTPLVAVIDQAMAHQYWPNGDAIGKRIRTLDPDWYTIIGVVPTVKEESLSDESYPHLYLNYKQVGFVYGAPRDQRRMFLVLNSDNPNGLVPLVRERLHALDPDVPMFSVNTMAEVISNRLSSQRLINLLLSAFSTIALLLAAIGTYGVMAIFVSSRSSEFAIRGALGASPRNLLAGVLRQGFWLGAIGCGLGLLGSWFLTRMIASQLFAVSATDPLVFTVTPLLLLAVALVASYSPARKAARTDPAVVLRQ